MLSFAKGSSGKIASLAVEPISTQHMHSNVHKSNAEQVTREHTAEQVAGDVCRTSSARFHAEQVARGYVRSKHQKGTRTEQVAGEQQVARENMRGKLRGRTRAANSAIGLQDKVRRRGGTTPAMQK